MHASVSRRRSVRWRLPASYAGIALLTALTLSIVLLSTVRGYYRQVEQDYLRENAEAIAATAEHLDIQSLSAEQLTSLARVFSFLAQTRVQFLAADGMPVADSGIPTSIELAFRSDGTTEAVASTSPRSWLAHSVPPEQAVLQSRAPATLSDIGFVLSELEEELTCTMPDLAFNELVIPAQGTLFGFGLAPGAVDNQRRSQEQLQVPIIDRAGRRWGSVQLSNGPSYGLQIVESIATHLLAASFFAIALAALAGWYTSRQISKPLLLLTQGAEQMAQGKLTTRVNLSTNRNGDPNAGPNTSLSRGDEFGLLSQTFNEMAAQIEETVEMLRRFVADAAHAIYTPLTALRTTLEVYEMQNAHRPDHTAIDVQQASNRAATALDIQPSSNLEDEELLRRAQAQVQQLIALTDDLLELSRIEAAGIGAQHHRPQQLCLNTFLQQQSERYASQADQAEIDLSLELPEKPITIVGHEPQVCCALDNLVDNALKFTPAGGQVTIGLCIEGFVRRSAKAPGEVSIEESIKASAQPRVQLWVRDSGLGVDEAEIPRLVERFYRGRQISAQPGSGLGLAIVAAIMENHNGQVAIHRTPTGTHVSLYFLC